MSEQPIEEQVPLEEAETPIDETELTKELPCEDNCSCNENLPEAGGIAFVELRSQHGVKIHVTARAHTAKQAISQLVDAIKFAKEKYKFEPVSVQGAPASKESPSAPAKPSAPVAPASPSAPSSITHNKGDVGEPVKVTKMEIGVRPDGKSEIKFYGSGQKFPAITLVRTKPVALKMLQSTGDAWEMAHLEQPATYDTNNYIVEWEWGDANTQGTGRYKNITAIKRV